MAKILMFKKELLWNHALSIFLFFKYAMLGKKLSIDRIVYLRYALNSIGSIEIYLVVDGCYKIIVNELSVYAGNVNSIQLPAIQGSHTVKLKFLGIKKEIRKNLTISIDDFKFKKRFPLKRNSKDLLLIEKNHSLQPQFDLLGYRGKSLRLQNINQYKINLNFKEQLRFPDFHNQS